MKTVIKTNLKTLALAIGLVVAFVSCSEDELGMDGTSPDANSINEYIANLSYNADELLNVQETGGLSSERTITYETDSITAPVMGTVYDCYVRDYDLESNFDDVAILRPTNGIIYPGALVKGNQGMLDGAPDPFAIGRAPVTLRLDLPGIGENGNIVVNDPAQNTEVQTGLDEALEWWNDNAYQDGYVNASNSTCQAATSYESTQLSFDIGLNAEWATGAVAAQFNYESNTERRVASIAFKQVFYTVTMNTPLSPGTVFGSNVSLEQVQAIMNSENPPAYVASVAYGRIIMVRMETTNMDTSINLEAVLEYSSGVNNATGDLAVTYDQILQNSSVSIVTLGGNAEVASSAVDAASIENGPGGLNYIITGENAVYSRTNPGVPIGYTVRYLKDNSLAKMGYTTEYRIEQCGSVPFAHEEVTVNNDSFHDIRFRFKYRGQDVNTIYNSPWYQINQDVTTSRTPPSGAHDVEVQTQYQCGAGSWNTMTNFDEGYVFLERCFRATGGNIICSPATIARETCN